VARTKQRNLVQTRLSDKSYRALKAKAKASTRSMANYLKHLIDEHLGFVAVDEDDL
jgi:hypothetical protein